MKITVLFCGAVLALTPLAVHAQSASPSPSPTGAPETCPPGEAPVGKHHKGPGGRGMMMGDRLAKELNLTPDQQNQLKPVFEENRTKVQAIRQDTSLSQEQKRAKIKEIREANKAKIEAVLTPDQKQKFESLRAQRGGKGHGGHAGHEGQGDE